MARPHEAPKHISFSSRETLLRCARSYFLQKIAGAPQRPALWLAGGSAVHEATELYDRLWVSGELGQFDLDTHWKALFDLQVAHLRTKEPNENAWRWSQSEPIPKWREQGLEFVRAYIDWRERSPWTIWTTPDGEPAIELDVSGTLPGCPVEVKAYLDRVLHDPVFDRLVIVDLKTGKRPPKNSDQFGTYKALLEQKYGVVADLGAPFMNRRATLGTPFDLSEHTPESVGAVYGEAWEQVQKGLETGDWPANGYPKDCWLCDVSASCYEQGGPLSARYDPTHPEFVPF